MKEDGESLPETMKEVLDQLDDIPKDVKKNYIKCCSKKL